MTKSQGIQWLKNSDMQSLVSDFVFQDRRLEDYTDINYCVYLYERKRFLELNKIPAVFIDLSQVQPPSVDQKGRGYLLWNELPGGRLPHDKVPEGFITQAGSVIAVPLYDGERIAGTLCLDNPYIGYFQEHHVRSAQLLATLLSFLQSHNSTNIKPTSITLGQVLKQVRQDLGITQEFIAERLSQSRITISRWEDGSQPPSPKVLYQWCRALNLVSPRNKSLISLIDISPQLLELLREDPQKMMELTPSQFEHLVAERLDRMGYDVTLTGTTTTRDGGIDLIAIPKVRSVGSFLLAGQIKHHRGSHKTGRDAVDRLLAWKDNYFSLGLLITNTFFTKDAIWTANQQAHRAFIRLRDFNDLKRWLEDYFHSHEDWQEIPEELTLAPGVTIAIPKPRLGIFKDSTAIPTSVVERKREEPI